MTSISVIIPTFNRREVLSRALDSVIAQSRPADEIIVIDDGSSDGTTDMLRTNYPDVKLLSQENRGVSAARNAGIIQARGEWLALLDSDDHWHPEKLEIQINAIRRQPGYMLVHTDELWIRDGVRVNQMKKHKKYGGHIFKYCLPICAISPSSSLIHASIFKQLGLFDENLPVCEDYDMWLRITARYPVLFVDEALITKYGGHEDQLSRKFRGMDRFRVRAIEKVLNEDILSPENREAAIKTLVKKIRIYLTGAKKHSNTDSVAYLSTLLRRYENEAPGQQACQ